MLEIKVTQTTTPKAKPDENNLGFGTHYTDHMFRMDYTEGQGWHSARIEPYQPISLDPAAMVFHYAQESFEGMKAYRTAQVCGGFRAAGGGGTGGAGRGGALRAAAGYQTGSHNTCNSHCHKTLHFHFSLAPSSSQFIPMNFFRSPCSCGGGVSVSLALRFPAKLVSLYRPVCKIRPHGSVRLLLNCPIFL